MVINFHTGNGEKYISLKEGQLKGNPIKVWKIMMVRRSKKKFHLLPL